MEGRTPEPLVRSHSANERQRVTSRAALLQPNLESVAPGLDAAPKNLQVDDESDFEAEEEEHHQTLRRFGNPSRATLRSMNTTKSVVETSKSAYIYAIGIALPISLICFTIQTELAQYIQAKLHYEKPYFMLYITHSSWWLNGVGMWCWLRFRAGRGVQSSTVTRRMLKDCVDTARVVAVKSSAGHRNLAAYMLLVIILCGICLTIAGGTWYVAVNLTTAADLSAIYNSSAFFAYAFSIPILHEKLRLDKVVAVALSIVGVLVIAYGDRASGDEDVSDGGRRALGNVIIAVGAVLYGLYEVLYKKYGCPPDQYDPKRSIVFANAVATGLGCFTLFVMWIPIPILHILGWEIFEFPPRKAALALFFSVASNFIYSSCLLAMISLTSPVLSSVACLLSIFVVAIVDTHITGEALTIAALTGGIFISVGFAVLSWATYVEMKEEAKAREERDSMDDLDILTSDEEDSD
ncbi:Putative uncharacterized protein [Taphrina deformans PYCC 5710]|uniref:EamA domain-containing protein n=1 Tax=Taphrina deformans (strain PYCC 5710 / ATCC 11124 / CBS 356.35 / IMI 108563 / JCM 9778 / NBRC 8474) TaxID=1097556 RepID=R4XCV2_TAPDE|nr:Putative uncharacterized protein [Taphrina deformans PYCC 5710]|eukprot:CCG82238.1 Putative uncharacterized protein [Taphrina deformans PYCC 5710]